MLPVEVVQICDFHLVSFDFSGVSWFRSDDNLRFGRAAFALVLADGMKVVLREMEAFILELGVGLCFVARQKRMQIDDEDYYLDLLFYHRNLRRLLAEDLKLGVFEAGDKGQTEIYLNWLKKHEQGENEEEPVGIILCAEKREQHVELLEVEASGIDVASYLAKTVPKKELERKLQEAMILAWARLQALKDKTE
jgi:YhcG PDDEXK nuclease domain